MKIVKRNGKNYLYVSNIKIDLNLKEFKYYMNNNEQLDELRKAVRNFIGSNHQEVIAAVKEPLEQAISKRILELSNNIVKHFTYEELFPDRA